MASRIAMGVRIGALAATAAALAGAALAQVGSQGGPIQINAQSFDGFRSEGRGVYEGNVDVIQGGARLRTDRLVIICAKPSKTEDGQGECSEIEKLVADGNVFYVTASERIKGDRGEYDYATDTITVTGDVILSRANEGVMRGRKLIYSVAEGRARMAGEEGQKGGVTGVFQRRSSGSSTASPSPTP